MIVRNRTGPPQIQPYNKSIIQLLRQESNMVKFSFDPPGPASITKRGLQLFQLMYRYRTSRISLLLTLVCSAKFASSATCYLTQLGNFTH